MSDHTFLVAFTVADPFDNYTREDAEIHLMQHLPRPEADTSQDRLAIESWWVAEDDRHDGSDNDSAVFVSPGLQESASRWLHETNFTPSCNVIDRPGSRFE